MSSCQGTPRAARFARVDFAEINLHYAKIASSLKYFVVFTHYLIWWKDAELYTLYGAQRRLRIRSRHFTANATFSDRLLRRNSLTYLLSRARIVPSPCNVYPTLLVSVCWRASLSGASIGRSLETLKKWSISTLHWTHFGQWKMLFNVESG